MRSLSRARCAVSPPLNPTPKQTQPDLLFVFVCACVCERAFFFLRFIHLAILIWTLWSAFALLHQSQPIEAPTDCKCASCVCVVAFTRFNRRDAQQIICTIQFDCAVCRRSFSPNKSLSKPQHITDAFAYICIYKLVGSGVTSRPSLKRKFAPSIFRWPTRRRQLDTSPVDRSVVHDLAFYPRQERRRQCDSRSEHETTGSERRTNNCRSKEFA